MLHSLDISALLVREFENSSGVRKQQKLLALLKMSMKYEKSIFPNPCLSGAPISNANPI
jgi:hypothetical protein